MAKEKTEGMIVALKAAKALVKESKNQKDVEAQIDELLLVANIAKDMED